MRRRLAQSDRITFAPAHDHRAAGAMAGIITGSMPVFVVEDEVSGERAFASISEGLGKTLRFRANDPQVIDRLGWIRDRFAPLLAVALRLKGPIDLRLMVAEALRRGDECSNRNKAATTLVFREIAASLVASKAPHGEIARAMDCITGNDHFLLSLSIARAKAVILAMEALGIGSLVTTMAGNRREVGIRMSGTGTSAGSRRLLKSPQCGSLKATLARTRRRQWVTPMSRKLLDLAGLPSQPRRLSLNL
ncbi:MAG: DUF1116 domain-containing protein [Acidobacteriaceae bacterium]|nr:DUF1116 domain-containing protein [Acidobacteriaceae bacterium]